MTETKQVPPEFRTRLVAAKAEIQNLKQAIGEEQLRHETQKVALFNKANAAGKAAEAIARDAAIALGLDPQAPGVSFDWGTLEFTGLPDSHDVSKRKAGPGDFGPKRRRR